MIYVNRNKIDQPEVFLSKEVEIANKRLEEFYNLPKEERSQKKYSSPFGSEFNVEILESLRVLFNGKCAYCESIIGVSGPASFDHFRPKSGARGLDRDFGIDHYWWLTYEWNNLYYCCHYCNSFKSTWFPVEKNRAHIRTSYADINSHENALLIDPCVDNPQDHLVYNESGEVDFLSPKGKTTIEIIKLNRGALVDERRNTIIELKKQFDFFLSRPSNQKKDTIDVNEVTKQWQDIFSGATSKPYLGIQRQILTKFFEDFRFSDYLRSSKANQAFDWNNVNTFKSLKDEGDKPFISKTELSPGEKEEINQSLNIDAIRHFYVENIEIENFKCFSYIKLDFKNFDDKSRTNSVIDFQSQEPWLLFLGENGVGKSSLLKAFVIALSGDEYIKDLKISGKDVLKYGKERGFIRVNLVGAKQPIEVTFNKKEIKTSLYQPIVNIVAYNAIRLSPKSGKLAPENTEFYGAKAKNLFDYTYSLIDTDNWLATRSQETFDRVALTLKDLMLLDTEDTIEIENDRIIVKRRGDKFLIEELSDGYKSIFYLAVDIMATLAGEKVTFDLAEGMVLIDEIGTHLHPRWRMEVVRRLRNAFPKIRFIVTTHEPLCLRGLYAGETVVLTKNQDKEIIALTELPDPSELRVDQILTSDFFGLKSTIDPQTEALFDEYYKILAINEEDRTGDQRNRLLELNGLIPRIKHLGDNLREELTYYVIDELLARKTREDGLKLKDKIEAEALKRVESLWKALDEREKRL